MKFRCPNCNNAIEIIDEDLTISTDLTCPSCHSSIDVAPSLQSTVQSLEGTTIGGFEVRQLLGEGSFGSVFQGWDAELQRMVAIKIPRPDRVTPKTATQFLKEARAAASLRHPGIVKIHEVGRHEDQLYIAADFIDGIGLDDWLKDHQPDFATAAEMVATICDAVHAAHEAGVVHRDLKPANVLIDKQSQLYVTDFGLAKQEAPADATVTRDGLIVGTPAYMPPEQADGRLSDVDRRSDVYSIGVMLYEMLTGRRPFVGTNARTLLFRIQTEQPPDPRSLKAAIPKDLQTVCLKAIRKESADRYESAAALADDLRRFLRQEPIQARAASVWEKLRYRSRRHPFVMTSALLAVVLAGVLLRSAFSEPPQPQAGAPAGGTAAREQPESSQTDITIGVVRRDGQPVTECRWAIAPLDPQTREPIAEEVVRRDNETRLQLSLRPAEYLIVVEIPGHGFHEVYRQLPEEIPDRPVSALKHRSVYWDSNVGSARWEDVEVLDAATATFGLVQIPGQTFVMGEGTKFSPAHQRQVDDFWIGQTEVTEADYRGWPPVAAMEVDLSADPRAAACRVTWHSAIAYAEWTGQRLQTEAEYELLATSMGRAECPSGNTADYEWDRWPYGPARETSDRLPGYDVYGLLSGVAEWTDCLPTPYPGLEDPVKWRLIMQTDDSVSNRVIRGGPVVLGDNDRSENTQDPINGREVSARTRAFFRMMTIDTEVGFRCARSVRPRLLEAAAP